MIHEQFAARLNEAADNARYPSLGDGRIKFMQIDIEEISGRKVRAATIGLWFRGVNMPRPEVAVTIAKALGVKAGWLFFGE